VRLADARFLYRTAISAWERSDRARRAPLVAALGTSVAGFATGVAARVAAQAAEQEAADAAPATPGPDVVPCTRTLISQQVIQQLANGVELRIPVEAKVTAMARDLAAARSIRISREV
ncbi:MAG TPA: hypothetical protein VK903_05705, partial [Propionicimonas sp.]|nr:hypothetical protein [Propionicimonas sp.]